jgi:hypothetical protein
LFRLERALALWERREGACVTSQELCLTSVPIHDSELRIPNFLAR